MSNITLTIPADWLNGLTIEQLRQIILQNLSQSGQLEPIEPITRALLNTGRVRHWPLPSLPLNYQRQSPPILAGPSLSDILIAQRRGEL